MVCAGHTGFHALFALLTYWPRTAPVAETARWQLLRAGGRHISWWSLQLPQGRWTCNRAVAKARTRLSNLSTASQGTSSLSYGNRPPAIKITEPAQDNVAKATKPHMRQLRELVKIEGHIVLARIKQISGTNGFHAQNEISYLEFDNEPYTH